MKQLLTSLLFFISLTSLAQPSYLDLSITFDEYPEETTWQIDIVTPEQDTLTILNSPSYDSEEFINSSIQEIIPLEANDIFGNPINYIFTINDSFGDGICCAYGPGYFIAGNQCQGLMFLDFEFDSSQQFFPFTLEPCNLPPPLIEGCTDPEALNYDANANADDGSCEYI